MSVGGTFCPLQCAEHGPSPGGAGGIQHCAQVLYVHAHGQALGHGHAHAHAHAHGLGHHEHLPLDHPAAGDDDDADDDLDPVVDNIGKGVIYLIPSVCVAVLKLLSLDIPVGSPLHQ